MAIVGNRYYNDPTIGQAFANLAQIFAPPSGSDLAGYATASAKKEEAARLAQLFDYAQATEGFNQSMFDRMGQATGQWTPSTGYYGVDQNNLTARRGQDIGAQTALTQTQMEQAGALERLYAEPVVAGANDTVYLPQQTQAATGLGPTLSGLVTLGQGEQATLPTGQVLSGAPKPLSETEMNALILSGMPIEDQRATILGDIPVEQIIQDGQPVIVRRNDAVGQQPAPTSTGQTETQNYRTRDGVTGTAYFDPNTKGWHDTQTGQPLPEGSTTFNSSLQGGAEETGLGPTTANNTTANLSAAEITSALNTLDVYEKLIRENPGSIGLVGAIRGTAQDALASIGDLTAAFGKDAPQVQAMLSDVGAGLERVAPDLYDPSIPEAQFLQGALAYSLARTENPSGEVSRQAYERALERIKGGGLLANQQSSTAAINAYRQLLNAQLSRVETLRDPASARTDTTFQPPPGAPTAPVGEPLVIQTPQGQVTIERLD